MSRLPGETLQEEINRVSEAGGGTVYLLPTDEIADMIVGKPKVHLTIDWPGRMKTLLVPVRDLCD